MEFEAKDVPNEAATATGGFLHVSNMNVNKLIFYPVNHRDVIQKDSLTVKTPEVPVKKNSGQ